MQNIDNELIAIIVLIIIFIIWYIKKSADIKELENQLLKYKQDFQDLDRDYAILYTRFEEHNRASDEKIRLLDEAKESLKNQFENLANQIFDSKSRSFEQDNQQQLQLLLKPFREQISEFSKRSEAQFVYEERERHLLKDEISRLKELNSRISEDAINLTNALKGENKTQGNWGEMILEKILESSGLREGHEYEVQATYTDANKKMLRPDVVVHLPQKKDIIIDSKVSLRAYEAYMREDNSEKKAYFLKQHMSSISLHVKSLSEKRYDSLNALRSLDFVILFMPIEGAFLLCLKEDENFFTKAYNKNIVIVSPSTLLVTLRTIEHIWRREHQEQNAKEIAKSAEELYDKFVGFLEDMQGISNQISKTNDYYERAMNKLSSGKGSLIKRSENMRKLGLKPKKKIPTELIEDS
jgi:DNA recombination protein RmuC